MTAQMRMTAGRRLAALVAPALAAVVFLACAVSSARQKSATYDEPVYVIAGLSYWTLGDYTMKEDAPPVVAYLAGLSPLLHGLEIPGGELGFDDALGNEYPFSVALLYLSGADADAILFHARLLVLVPFGLLLLITVWRWSHAMFGAAGAALSLTLAALSPNLIAHGRLVAADFPAAAAMLLAAFLLWRLVQDPTPLRAGLAGLALGLALTVKFTSLLMLPVTLVAIGLIASRQPERRWGRPAFLLGLVVLPALLCTTLVYGAPDPTRYWHGVATIYRNLETEHAWYLFGKFYLGGTPLYYPAALAVKTALPLLALGLGSVLLRGRTAGLAAELLLFLPAVLLVGAATQDAFTAGIRRVLLVLPVLAISAGRWASVVRGRPVVRALLVLLALAQGVTSLRAWPHYIPYFHELAGGRDNSHELLDGANVDWGQDLAALPAVLREHGVSQAYLCYFGTEPPEYRRFRHTLIQPEQLAPRLATPPPGVYAVSLEYLIRFRLTAGRSWLDTREPFTKAGTSIWLYRVPQ